MLTRSHACAQADELKSNQVARYLEAAEEELAAAINQQQQQPNEQLMLASADINDAPSSSSSQQQQQGQQRGAGGFPGATAFASMSLGGLGAGPNGGRLALSFGMGVSKAVLGAFSSMPLASSRPRLIRPSHQRSSRK